MSNKQNRLNNAFTMLESFLALIVSVMVIFGLTMLTHSRKDVGQIDALFQLQSACQQLQEQGYQLISSDESRLELSNEGHLKRLLLKRHRLILQGRNRGEMVLLTGLQNLSFRNQESYQIVEAKTEQGEKLRAFWVLPKEVKKE